MASKDKRTMTMSFSFKTAAVIAAVGLAAPATARPVDIALKMNSYSGQRAYLAAYVVDPKGQYATSLLIAGSNGNYLAHMDRWYRMIMRAGGKFDGTTGASIGSGETMKTRVEVPDAMLNAGFTLRVESAVENQNYVPNEAAVELSDANNGKSVAGSGYVQSMTVSY
jgi:hypothetical protein